MEEMVGYTTNPVNKEISHSTKAYEVPVASARLNEEMSHGIFVRELWASATVASKVQQALALYEAFKEDAKHVGNIPWRFPNQRSHAVVVA